MEQQIADLLRQNQDLIRALQIRDDSHSHKVTVQFDKFDEENENFDSFIERFETYLDVQNVPIANRAKVFVSSLSAKLYQLLKICLRLTFLPTKRFEQYPLLSKVELKTKLTDLKRGYHRKVDSSEWATPVVPVVKSDGSIRLCADYSVTLNPNLIVPQHPLPRLDEIFGSLNILWSKDCQVAFEQIKKEICSPKILVHYDPSLPLTLASDASPVGIGCVLSHVYPDGSERPIAFASRTLSGSRKILPN
ncbi:uncharacterized protein K02A2.6 [Trichonephila clavipes]|nr:uncharacterized protein K02A2.6 [Trichonephila clavipes]